MRSFTQFLPFFFISTVFAGYNNQGEEKSVNTQDFTVQVKWGLKSKTKQKWDGSVNAINGTILKVTPFIRHSMIDEEKLISKNSWISTTYTSTEGVFIHLIGYSATILSFSTLSGDFHFKIDTLHRERELELLSGHVQISDISDKYNFKIEGLEHDIYGEGKAIIKPKTADVDSYGTWEIQYTCGNNGIKENGGIRISWHFTKDWGTPQFNKPESPNFVSYSHSNNSKLLLGSDHQGFFEYPFTNGRILILAGEDLEAGSKIKIVLGDTKYGSPGYQSATIADSSFVFRVESCSEYKKNEGFPIYRRLKNNPTLNITSKKIMENIFIVVPTISKINQYFSAKFRIEDKFRNKVENDFDYIEIYCSKNNQKRLIKEYYLPKNKNHGFRIDSLKLTETGIWHIEINKDKSLLGRSNPIYITSGNNNKKIYWGELHGHTKFSDGYGSAIKYLQHAKNNAFLDFAFITDHDVELDAPDFTVKQMYETNKKAVKRISDNRFISGWSWEWSPNRTTTTSKYPYGDHNVYFLCDKTNIFPSGELHSQTLPQLYDQLKNHKQKEKIHIIPHVGGAITNWEYHSPYFEKLAEIYSVHGSFENFGQIALDKGYHVGFVAASDSHSGQIGGFSPGVSANHFVNGGLTAIITNNLSDGSLSSAMKKRMVYATTGKRIFVDFKINNEWMGSIIKSSTAPTIHALVSGEKQIRILDILKNGRVIHTKHNKIINDGTLHILWKNDIDKNDLTNFNEGFWSRRLRSVNWTGLLESDFIELIDVYSFETNKDIITKNNSNIKWNSDTRGDYDGIAIKVNNQYKDITLSISTNDFKSIAGPSGIKRKQTSKNIWENFKFSYNSIPDNGLELSINSRDKIFIYKGTPEFYELSLNYTDNSLLHKKNYYYLRATQIDGNMAWSSPIWVEYDY